MPRTKYIIVSSPEDGLSSKPMLALAIRRNPPRIDRHPKTKNIQTVIVAIALKIAGILASLCMVLKYTWSIVFKNCLEHYRKVKC